MKPPKGIELNPAEVEALLDRVEHKCLQEGDYEIIKGLVEAFVYLSQAVDEKSSALKRLLQILFGAKTETREKLFQIAGQSEDLSRENLSPPEQEPKQQQPGHGRNGAEAYSKAERIHIPLPDLKAGQPCRECIRGKLYPVKHSGTLVRFVGMAPLAAKIYELQKLRCHLCGEVFTAPPPAHIGSEKYDQTAGAMIAQLKYDSGVPFYRIEKLQQSMGIPLPASTQWDIVENAANGGPHPAYRELVRQAAQGHLIHNDDTPMKILERIQDVNQKSSRTGMFTTGVVSLLEDHKIALFFTGPKHAGENMTELLQKRGKELGPPLQMCDALSRNMPETLKTILANCLVHGRRNFVEVADHFPEETRHVIDQIALVYKTDQAARDQNLSPQERWILHQQQSGPVMKDLKIWLSEQLDQKKTEPNSGLGKAIAYMLKHWDPLTLFLRVPGAPLDNNICEQALKKTVLHRKNAYFFKTQHGAFIGDLFMSLIHTCHLNGIHPFDYLVALQKHSSEVFKSPQNWLPWNYQASLPTNTS
jgi:transposase